MRYFPARRRARRTFLATRVGTYVALTLAATSTGLAACAGPPDGHRGAVERTAATNDNGIASLQTPGEGTSPAGPTATDPLVARYGEPVRLRLDMSDGDETAAYEVYDRCVTGESGLGPDQLRVPGADSDAMSAAGGGDPAAAARLAEASERCLVVQPLPPWEYDVQNPDAVNFTQAIVDCLHTHGVTYAEVTQDSGRVSVALGGDDNDGQSVSQGMAHYDQCERDAVAWSAGR